MGDVLIMAGGLGLRLRPLTEDRPKPLVEVGGRPIIESLIERLVAQGFRRIFISVNHLADQITEYFGDGTPWGAEISYVPEPIKLGTAGALKLLPDAQWPLLVVNGDLITDVDFGRLVGWHNMRKASATMCVRDYRYAVPYGVVKEQAGILLEVQEKPVQTYKVNAGIYVLEKSCLQFIEGHTDMPEIFAALTMPYEGLPPPAVYKIDGRWMDIGTPGDLQHAERILNAV